MSLSDQEVILISSLVINILLIIERFLKRIKRSKCCGSELELSNESSTPQNNISSLELKDIKINEKSIIDK